MLPRGGRWLLAAASAALLAGCGNTRDAAQTPSGRVLFSEACGSCHSLSGVEDPRRQGGDLLRFQSSRAQLMELAGEMPVTRPLTETQLRAVVSYVMAVERRHG
jgi:mono/diheme cytochrome c family protein